MALMEFAPSLSVVSLRGEQDISNLEEVSAALAAAIARDEGDVALDLSALEFLDASIAGAIIRASEFLRARSRSLVLRAPSSQVQRVLGVCGGDALTGMATATAGQGP